jgi:4-hydroxythreonine-4-phosphate dehydrogenase
VEGDRPRLAVTLGDPRGIGPEITRAALRDAELRVRADIVTIGAEEFAIPGVEHEPVGRWSPEAGVADAGRIAALSIERAADLALDGRVAAVVTAPIDKSALHAAGWRHPGHTEMLRDLAGAPAVAMMMAAEVTRLGGPLRVVLATTHLPLREVPAHLTDDLLVEQASLTSSALARWWGADPPRIALCAFNPHASDNGLFGDEEERIYKPALERLGSLGILVSGPIPADTVFGRTLAGEFDAVVAPYHDVGMAPFKTVSFGSGVNVTLGLPFPRTSPDHGTALDIAGRGIARPDSMLEALRLAVRLAARTSPAASERGSGE